VSASITGRDSQSGRQDGRHRLRSDPSASVAGRARRFIGESLIRNSAWLGTNVVIGAVTGLGTLALLTRLYPVRAIGLSAAATSATGLITAISQLGLNYSVVRFLPTSKQRDDLINSVLTAAVAVAFISGVVFLSLPSAARLHALGGLSFVAMFLLAGCLTTANGLLQNVFVADRNAGRLVTASVVESVVRLAAPAAFLFVGLAGAYVAQGVVPVAATFVVLAVLLARRGHRFRPRLSLSATRHLLRFSAGVYVAGLIGGLPVIVLPLIILSRFGASENAYWYTAIAGASVLFSIPGSISQALLAEAAHRPEARRALVRRSVMLITAVMLPVIAFAYLAAPVGLALLGHRYAASGLTTLRWLIVAAGMTSVNYVAGTILYLAKKSLAIACINTVDAVVVLGLSLTWARNVDEVAIAWVVGEVGNVILFALLALAALVQVRWRWESLGADKATVPTRHALPGPSPESQLAGLEMLLSLATHQIQLNPMVAGGQGPPSVIRTRPTGSSHESAPDARHVRPVVPSGRSGRGSEDRSRPAAVPDGASDRVARRPKSDAHREGLS